LVNEQQYIYNKRASKLLDCSTQNIYQQKSKLIKLGLMEYEENTGYVLNEKGINYLREKRTETIKSLIKLTMKTLNVLQALRLQIIQI